MIRILQAFQGVLLLPILGVALLLQRALERSRQGP